MIYRISSERRDYYVSGTPDVDLPAAYRRFLAGLSPDPGPRYGQLVGVLAELTPDVDPTDPGVAEDLEIVGFLAVACDSLDLRLRRMTDVVLSGPPS